MIVRCAVSMALVACLFHTHAQSPAKWGFRLEHHLAKAPADASVDLFIGGEGTAVAQAVLKHGGTVKQAVKGWVSASVPCGRVRALAIEPAITNVQFTDAPGVALNDSMRVRARVVAAQAGEAPLASPFSGAGVLVGVIDTGIDPAHPDLQDEQGHTRVLHFWDQTMPFDAQHTPAGYDYGQAWDSTAINNGTAVVTDHQYGHGTTVAGAAAGDGSATGRFIGVAPDADLIVVANDLSRANWSASVVDAVAFIIAKAEALGRPVSINLSLGNYYGSHDGLDPAALMIDDLLTAQRGRVLVCAAGNSGALAPYHLRTAVASDTAFTWFRYKTNSALGMHSVYFDLWADTAHFNDVHFSVGADRRTGGYRHRGQLPFRTIHANLGTTLTDTLKSFSGNRLAVVQTYAEQRGGQYHLEVFMPLPDSADNYYYRFSTVGEGLFDVWSSSDLGTSQIITAVPTVGEFPPIARYVQPDNEQSVVDSWACSPHVITVGNYRNEMQYMAANGVMQDLGFPENTIAATSSRGPSRQGLIKPELAAPGDICLAPGPIDFMAQLLATEPHKLAEDGMHMRNGGTSMASPVVAGIVALLLEKCPRASWQDVREALITTAFADEHTGPLPGLQFGHGKVDAFAALVHTNFQASIGGPAIVCDGDSVLLSGSSGMDAYAWSTGSDSATTHAHGGEVVLYEVDAAGCRSLPDTLVLEVLPLPLPVATVDGIDLHVDGEGDVQWFLDGAPLDGANTATWEALVNGSYHAVVTDGAGCAGASNAVEVVSVGVVDIAAQDISLQPVPTDGAMRLSGLPGVKAYRILDVAAREVGKGSLAEDGLLDVRELPAGTYLLQLPGSGRSLRFVKR